MKITTRSPACSQDFFVMSFHKPSNADIFSITYVSFASLLSNVPCISCVSLPMCLLQCLHHVVINFYHISSLTSITCLCHLFLPFACLCFYHISYFVATTCHSRSVLYLSLIVRDWLLTIINWIDCFYNHNFLKSIAFPLDFHRSFSSFRFSQKGPNECFNQPRWFY